MSMVLYEVPRSAENDRSGLQRASTREWSVGLTFLAVEAFGERLPDRGAGSRLVKAFSGYQDVVMVRADEARWIVDELDRVHEVGPLESAGDAAQLAALRGILAEVSERGGMLAVVTD